MNKTIKNKFVTFASALMIALAAVVVPVALPATTYAAECDTSSLGTSGSVQGGINCAQGNGTSASLFGTDSIFTTVVNILLFIIGAICVIMLIWGGIRYTTSAGNSASVTGAKNTIMYAIIGLIVAFLAFAIVNWVLGAITPSA